MSRSAPALPASAVALQSIFMTYASCPAEGPPFLDAERFIDLLEACPDLLTADFTMDQAMDVFDAVTEESDPGLSLEQFLAALSDIAEERYPEQGACHALVVGRAAWTRACIARALALTRFSSPPHTDFGIAYATLLASHLFRIHSMARAPQPADARSLLSVSAASLEE